MSPGADRFSGVEGTAVGISGCARLRTGSCRASPGRSSKTHFSTVNPHFVPHEQARLATEQRYWLPEITQAPRDPRRAIVPIVWDRTSEAASAAISGMVGSQFVQNKVVGLSYDEFKAEAVGCIQSIAVGE